MIKFCPADMICQSNANSVKVAALAIWRHLSLGARREVSVVEVALGEGQLTTMYA